MTYKTSCCQSKIKIISKLKYLCFNCNKDVTLEYLYFIQFLEDKKNENKNI